MNVNHYWNIKYFLENTLLTDIKMKVLLLPKDTRGDKRSISMLLIDSHCYHLHERLQEIFMVRLKEVLLSVHPLFPIALKLFKRLDLMSQYITYHQSHLGLNQAPNREIPSYTEI